MRKTELCLLMYIDNYAKINIFTINLDLMNINGDLR
jgi:hypothetical protein